MGSELLSLQVSENTYFVMNFIVDDPHEKIGWLASRVLLVYLTSYTLKL